MTFDLEVSSPECEREEITATTTQEEYTYLISRQDAILKSLEWSSNVSEINCPTEDIVEIVENGRSRIPTD